MSLLLRLSAAFFGGLALNRFYKPSLRMPPRWASMFREAIGVAGMHPFMLMVNHALRDVDDDDERFTLTYFMTALFFAAGVFAGHVLTVWVEQEDES